MLCVRPSDQTARLVIEARAVVLSTAAALDVKQLSPNAGEKQPALVSKPSVLTCSLSAALSRTVS